MRGRILGLKVSPHPCPFESVQTPHLSQDFRSGVRDHDRIRQKSQMKRRSRFKRAYLRTRFTWKQLDHTKGDASRSSRNARESVQAARSMIIQFVLRKLESNACFTKSKSMWPLKWKIHMPSSQLVMETSSFCLRREDARPTQSNQPAALKPAEINGEECETPEPNIRPGKCIGIRDCAELLSLLGGPNRNVEYVKQSVCSVTIDGDFGVCCPVAMPPPPPKEETFNKMKLFPDPLQHECGYNGRWEMYRGDAPLGKWNWMALLFYRIPGGGVKPGCGGAVINKRYVITAAQCFSPGYFGDAKLTFVRLGEHKLSTNPDCSGRKKRTCQPPVIDADVEEVIYHPNFTQKRSEEGAKFDIALIRLANDIDLRAGYSDAGQNVGSHSEAPGVPKKNVRKEDITVSLPRPNNGSDVLQQLKVPIAPLTKCAATPIYKNVELSEEQVCAGGEPNSGPCKGEQGGPLVVSRPPEIFAQYFLIGVFSFGTPYCGLLAAPSVYTRVTHYLDWILQHVRE
ncbi:unnamed protein product [Darwinula stevensoni]|uniref:CLIP domain-containing serine protease n=1 Tax=Darwinula stevensoni TaxID=69355 RepID=A0A7R8X1T8_9CRUS|nr:unnamed protein product [Darwinula stevensoni]CAG0883161.1 unnamed protein product [Darwinula stevensoni]